MTARCRAGCWCSAAARSASRWRRRCARMGGSVALVEGMDHVLPREPRAARRRARRGARGRRRSSCYFGQHASAARRDGGEYVLEFPDGERAARRPAAGGHRAAAARRRASASRPSASSRRRGGIEVDARMSAGDGMWAIGDVTGIWPLTYVGKYQGRVAAANILGRRPRGRTTTPCRGWCSPTRRRPRSGEADGPLTATVSLPTVPRTATYTRDVRQRRVHDARLRRRAAHRRLRARPRGGRVAAAGDASRSGRGVPLDVMDDVIQPFPTFSEVFLHALLSYGHGCGRRVERSRRVSTRLASVSRRDRLLLPASSGDAPRLAHVVDVDAHEGPVYVADEHALYFTIVPRPGRAARSSTSSGSTSALAATSACSSRTRRWRTAWPSATTAALLVCEQGTSRPPRSRASTAQPARARRSSTRGRAAAELAQRRRRQERRHDLVHRPELRVAAGLPAAAARRRRRLPLRPANRPACGRRRQRSTSPTASASRPTSARCTSATTAQPGRHYNPAAAPRQGFDVAARGSRTSACSP